MRDDETDEAEHARGTYGGCGKQRCKNEEDQTGARDVYAETAAVSSPSCSAFSQRLPSSVPARPTSV